MTTATVAVVGNPNAGKTSLFNALTGARQKVGNYPGVTVERKAARLTLADGRHVEMVDLPGAYSLNPRSPDEEVTRRVLLGTQEGEGKPSALVCVVDATNLRNHLRFVLELKRLGLPMVVALNMIDLAERDGIKIDVARLQELLGLPVVTTVAVRRRGLDALLAQLPGLIDTAAATATALPPADVRALQSEARTISGQAVVSEGQGRRITRSIDRVVLHPVAGPLILAAILFLMFQAVFAWAEAPMSWIEGVFAMLSTSVANLLPEGWLRSLINDGVIAGVGSVVVFLPQILILFAFILVLEQSGYMTRAAFLMDRVMARVGLNGRAFIPLLSSFACAVPGIMATRSIDNPRDRLTTILIAPLMTCSARLPVYTIIIAAFIPDRAVWGGIGLQGLVLFILYVVGALSALGVAWVLRSSVVRGASQTFLIEMPKYQLPALRDMAIGLWQRAVAFLKRAGTIILISTVVLWFLATFPAPPAGATDPAIDYSIIGYISQGLEVIFAPIGFNREIALALLPGMAAREVAVSALGTVYALQGSEDAMTLSLVETLRSAWPLPTALAFLAWYVFAPQCLSTLAVVRRETNGWKWTLFMFGYLFALAYVASGLTYWISRALLGA
ncbi:ferrous iron transporter B [Pedomonas mirosovicensis]|uniref:ferrous iron transporter B n=1 Tax=Pedomonas mirosovicensis TaxID=2908641 RepID=UPI0021689EBC|nr:ferrous iron transporter B [Pedomonas mirosovicensis]MCH8684763.1 ferrous iron transporter B [Pedomonas mirosovicensis]